MTTKATERNDETTNEAGDVEVERLKEDLRREHDVYLRALADFDNYRRRVERERASAARSGKRLSCPLRSTNGRSVCRRRDGARPR